MKKVNLLILSMGLIVSLCGCSANTTSEQVDNEKEMTIVKDELVSTSDKVVEEINKDTEKADINQQSKTEEASEDRESIQTDKVDVGESVEKEEKKDAVDNAIPDTAVYADGIVTNDDFAIQIGNVFVPTGVDMNTLVEQLGTPDDFVQARSCLYDGDDKVYTYGGIAVYTYPNGAEDIIYLIEVTGKEKLPSDVGVGSTVAEVAQAYGSDYAEFGTMMAYDLSDTASISFQIENDIVTFIEIYNE